MPEKHFREEQFWKENTSAAQNLIVGELSRSTNTPENVPILVLRGTCTQDNDFLFLLFGRDFSNLHPEKFISIWRIDRNGIRAIKSETA